ncbi:MAG: hypothetical protein HOP23_11245 [Methylococcaceae bacterium]|nr:hypothetical protein [Methylococcaceae bacterium]
MVERIVARPLKREDDAIEWLLMDDPAMDVHQGSLTELSIAAINKRVTLLVPASEVVLLAVELPVKTNAQIKKALPFALDDLLADDVETFHLVWHRHIKDCVDVAGISHERMQAYVSTFQALDIELDSVYPETFGLPSEPDSCSLFIEQSTAVVRYGDRLGGGVDVDALPSFISQLLKENPGIQSLQLWHEGAPAPQPELSAFSIPTVHHSTDKILRLFQSEVDKLNGAFNLLTAPYSRKSKDDWQWRQWLPTLAVALLALLIQFGIFIGDYWQKNSQLSTLETRNLALFKQTFPDVKRVVNIKVQAEQQLNDLKKQASNDSQFMRLLYQSGDLLTAHSSFIIEQMDFVNDIFQIRLTAPNRHQVDQFKQQLESQSGLSVNITSVETGQQGVEANLEIRDK